MSFAFDDPFFERLRWKLWTIRSGFRRKHEMLSILDKRISKGFKAIIFGLSLLTLSLSGVWWYTKDSNWEPLISFLLVLIGIIAFVFEPIYQKRQDRLELMESLWQEMRLNEKILFTIKNVSYDEQFEKGGLIYARLLTSSLDRALASPAINMNDDRGLMREIGQTRVAFDSFNRFLTILELHMFASLNAEAKKMHHAAFLAGSVMKEVMAHVIALNQLTAMENVPGQRPKMTPSERKAAEAMLATMKKPDNFDSRL